MQLLRTFRLLVVEDSALLFSMYQATFQKLATGDGRVEVTVEYARDGAEAMARIGRPPSLDLLVADLYMPVMDGFTLVERLRADRAHRRLPIMAISAGGDEARTRALDLGADVFLQKPVRLADMLEAARSLLRIPPG
jgi:CheY-like chemotaxis protein